MRPLLVSLAPAALALLIPAGAGAYCRTTTSLPPANYDPVTSGCIPDGVPLAWPSMPVTFELNQAASNQVSLAAATPIFQAAFASWAAASCSSGDASADDASVTHPALSFQMLSPTTAPFNPCDGGDEACEQTEAAGPHQIIFRDDDWPYQDTANTIALTTVSFGVDTGEIRAANMEINSFQHKISLADPPPADAVSLAAIATHEAGHFIGLAHSQRTSAVMYAYYEPGMTSLTQDDVDGVCTIYPPSKPTTSSGCSCDLGGRPDGSFALGLAGMGLAVVVVRRRRRR